MSGTCSSRLASHRRDRPATRLASARLGALVATLAIVLALPSRAAAPERPLIAIDVGHSLAWPGAISARGVPEFQFNRTLAMVVERTLRARGFRTRLIGEQGDLDTLTGRTAAAADAKAIFFLSLHHDSVQERYLESWPVDGRERRYSDRFSGYSLFVSRKNPNPAKSLACASAFGEAMRSQGFAPSLHHAEPIPGENRPLADAPNGVYYFDDLVVLKTAASPAVLVEAGIILNRDDERVLGEPATRERIARAIANGLTDCLADSRGDRP